MSKAIEILTDSTRAAVLLQHPLRPRILALAKTPVSASDLARQVGLPRQKVNYHLRQLHRAGFLAPAGERMKRNMVERQYVATARSYVLAPQVIGPAGVAADAVASALSAARVVALAARAQEEVTSVIEAAGAASQTVATLAADTEIRFESAEQRVRFTEALLEAMSRLVADYTSPAILPDGAPGPGRPFRLMLCCYPTPPRDTEEEP